MVILLEASKRVVAICSQCHDNGMAISPDTTLQYLNVIIDCVAAAAVHLYIVLAQHSVSLAEAVAYSMRWT
jgi:hypothetical protein